MRERPPSLCHANNRHDDQGGDSTDNNEGDRITWGEFCVLASELHTRQYLMRLDTPG